MNKRKLYKYLKNDFDIKKAKGPYDFDLVINGKTHRVLVMKTTPKCQVTLNSLIVWEVACGRVDGLRFIKTQKMLVRLDEFQKLDNKIVYLTEKPFRILKYLNESDIIDVTDNIKPNGEYIITHVEDFHKIK